MLEELLIRDLGVIAEVGLTLAPGLNVVTGETGAGKTMVVSALELLLGVRADSARVRAGATGALVEGRLRPPPPGSREWLAEGDDELVVSREVLAGTAAAGRSRARIGGRLAPVSALAATVGAVVDVHGQSEVTRLSTAAAQRDLLDRYGGPQLAGAAARHRAAYERWRSAEAELERLRGDARERARQLDRLRFELGEIDAVAPVAGEEIELQAQLQRLEQADALRLHAASAAAALTDDGGARDRLGWAVAELRTVAGVDAELDRLHQRLEGLAAEAQDLGFELVSYGERIVLDPQRLELLRQRRAALAALARKYGPDAAAVVAYAEDARTTLAALEHGDERAGALAADVTALRAEVAGTARQLTELRCAAGRGLARAVEEHLAELALPDARVVVAVESVPLAPHGADRVAFLLAANPGQPPLPLATAASGGERSRLGLALRLALADVDATGVLVFDEVDAGIGGTTALAVGRKLARLARHRQVLCVTHLAQLAAFADAHFVVSKRSQGRRAVASVRRLSEPDRVAELSRMLSGAGSPAAAEHAAELRALALGGAGAHPR
ncbi:MAG TPA: DNA repair protein RecN [Egibacteraceae bacterium]|nr:DNA repair protein RecN [Egibacteraceae bacterium]